ncbi:hypothetical protein HRbin26_01625 [bacterium HR26]|nr:hypothetical protein HRbin26_01625 [bacterium HR26]
MLIGAGWLLGENWERVSYWIETYSNLVVVLVLAALGMGLYLLVRRRRASQCEL